MFTTTNDLRMCSRAVAKPPCPQTKSESSILPTKHTINRNKKHLFKATSVDSADEIQVIENQQAAIPIQTAHDPRPSDRHSDLDIGSVHAHRRRSSPLFERRKRDDIDLLGESMDSSDDEYRVTSARDSNDRGRERRTKPLLHRKQTHPPHRQQRSDYNIADMTAYSPRLGYPVDCGYSPEAVSKQYTRYHNNENMHKHAHRSHQGHDKPFNVALPVPSVLEHEAMVFDNFEDISSIYSASEQEQENQDPFDAHLHFVRPAMPICTNPGAFVTLEPLVTPTSSLNGGLEDTEQASSQAKRNRLGHHRTASELFPTSSANSKLVNVRATRRRATVGAEAAYRFPTLSRRGDLSA
ncbi:uncharacterized protein UDID_03782 [Ustilago sp. UG-2017a]|nr:uncharacterized protein UDID_03782 [Ustilago sp. UG-2017a]